VEFLFNYVLARNLLSAVVEFLFECFSPVSFFCCIDCLLHGRGGSFPTQCINPVQLRARVGRALIIPICDIKASGCGA